MLKYHLKIIAAMVFTGFYYQSLAQISYKRWTFSAGLGATNYVGTVPKSAFNSVYLFDFDHFFSRQFSMSFAWQTGKLSGGSMQSDIQGREFETDFNAGILCGKLYLAKFDDHPAVTRMGLFLQNTYVGLGVGLLGSQISKINRTSKQGEHLYGQDQAVAALLSINLGSNWDFFNKFKRPVMYCNVNFQFNFTSTDQLDGYTVPLVISRGSYDNYIVSSLKFGFYIGENDFFYKHRRRGY